MSDRTTPTRRDRIILRTATPAGLVLFAATLLGNYSGRAILPFDQHHFIGQVGGFGLILWASCTGSSRANEPTRRHTAATILDSR